MFFFKLEEQVYNCYFSMVVNINYEDGWYSLVYICDLQIDWSLRTIVFCREKNPKLFFLPIMTCNRSFKFFLLQRSKREITLTFHKGGKNSFNIGQSCRMWSWCVIPQWTTLLNRWCKRRDMFFFSWNTS